MTKRDSFTVALAVLALVACGHRSSSSDDAATQSRAPLWVPAEGGAHAVGVQVLALIDSSRSDEDQSNRAVQVTVWYPADTNTARLTPHARFRSYVALADNRRLGIWRDTLDSAGVERYRASWFPSVAPERVAQLLDTPVAAKHRVTAARGRWPLVLYAVGLGGAPLTHTPTAEFLASHGYVVVMLPAIGHRGAPQQYTRRDQSEAVQDFIAAWSVLRHSPMVDTTRIATIGFSFGGNIAMLLAQQLPNVLGVVSLHGSPLFFDGHPLLSGEPRFVLERATHPFLAVLGTDAIPQDLAMADLLPSVHQERLMLQGLQHHDVIGSAEIAARVTDSVSTSTRAIYHVTLLAVEEFLRRVFGRGGSEYLDTRALAGESGLPATAIQLCVAVPGQPCTSPAPRHLLRDRPPQE